jgi:hypothetical protein
VIAAALSFVRHAAYVSVGEFLNIIGVDWPILTLGCLIFHSGRSVKSGSFAESHLIVIKDICLRGANIRSYLW